MGSNNLHSVADDDHYVAADINQFTTALTGDIIPRNLQGVPAARAGAAGTQAFPLSQVHTGRLFVNGTEITGSDSSGSTSALQNGVVAGAAPSGYPSACGWLLQAGSSGVKLNASSTSPLTIKLDGVSYQLNASITGGTLPSALSLSRSLQNYTTPSGGYNSGEYYEYSTRTRPRFMLATGGIFKYSSSDSDEVAAANGDIFIFKHGTGASTGYIVAQRHGSGAPLAKLASRESLNTSATGFTHGYYDLPSDGAVTLIRTGYIFADPTANPWTISISARIVGAVNVLLPADDDALYSTGDMVYRELDARWYRFSGSAWQKSSSVFLGICAIDGSSVVGVMGVRGETAMNEMLACRNDVLGSSLFITGVETGGSIYFSGSADLEAKMTASLMSQSLDKVANDPVINIADDGTKANSKLFCCYLNIPDRTYFYDESPPMILYYGGRVIHAHQSRHAVFFGSFATDGSGNVITRLSITGSQSASHTNYNEITESNDDQWWINPLLYFRMEFETPLNNAYGSNTFRVYPDIELRQGTGTQSRQFDGRNTREGYDILDGITAPWIDQFFTDAIQPMVLDGYRFEIYSSDNRASGRLRNWTEAELIEHLGLR